jgi:RimJ/RimL family protein N-acetyltransferase
VEARAAVTERVALGEGRAVLIGPLHSNDRARYLDGIGRASAESVYKRFMTPVSRLTTGQIAYLLGVDHHDHEAYLAVDEESGEAVAVGRFVRDEERPELAEAAVIVVDDWQGLGLGKAVCRALANRARALGIERFEATMLSDNRAMMAVLESLGEVRFRSSDGGTVTVELILPEPEHGERVPGALTETDGEGFEVQGPPGP